MSVLESNDEMCIRDSADCIYRFGESLGLAFQLQDDWLDVYGDPARFGKKIGGDILNNKKTYMLINARQRVEGKDAEELSRWLSAAEYDPSEKIAAVTALYDRVGAGDLCLRQVDEYKMCIRDRFNPFRTLSLVDDSPEIFTNVCNKGRTCSCDGKLYLAVSET